MTNALVIDTTSRELASYVANVTTAEAGLVVRKALELPGLFSLVGGRGWSCPMNTSMPVLIIGDGYKAISSEGHVNVSFGKTVERTSRPTIVVGMQDFNAPLRAVRPQLASFYEAGRLMRDRGMGNSNAWTAAATAAGIDLLLQADPRSILFMEGQSDYEKVVRLLPENPKARLYELVDLLEVDKEHRGSHFTYEAIVADMIRALTSYAKREGHTHPRDFATFKVGARLDSQNKGVDADVVFKRHIKEWLTAFEAAIRSDEKVDENTTTSEDAPIDENIADWERELQADMDK